MNILSKPSVTIDVLLDHYCLLLHLGHMHEFTFDFLDDTLRDNQVCVASHTCDIVTKAHRG